MQPSGWGVVRRLLLLLLLPLLLLLGGSCVDPIVAQWTQVGAPLGLTSRAGHVMWSRNNNREILIHAGGGRTDVLSSLDGGQTWATIGNIDNRRQEHTVLSFQNKYWSIAGFNSTVVNQIRVSTDDGATWSIVNQDESYPHPFRADHCSVVWANQMWTLGGSSSPPPTAYNTVYSSVNGSTWISVPQLGSPMWSPRYGFACTTTAAQSSVYIIGGRDTVTRGFAEVWVTHDMLSWALLATGAVPGGGVTWSGRAFFAFQWVESMGGAFLAGGRDVSNVLKNDVFYSPNLANWTLISAAHPASWSARELTAMTLSNSSTLVLACGNAGSSQSDVHQFQIPNPCVSSPCHSGASCINHVLSFACVCVAGYTGVLCETNIDECASQPCMMAGTQTCVDGIASYRCQCLPGYSGTRCETQLNECASQPCANGGVCMDLPNAFYCNCTLGWSGSQCVQDVNECATQHGGCVSEAVCDNTPGGYNCSAAVAANTLQPAGPLLSGFQSLTFRFGLTAHGHTGAELLSPLQGQLALGVGPADQPDRFPCELVPADVVRLQAAQLEDLSVSISSTNGGPFNLSCVLTADGYGANQSFWARSFGRWVAYSVSTLHFPAPQIVPGSLRLVLNATDLSDFAVVLALPTVDTQRIAFDVAYVSASLLSVTRVRYGLSQEYACTITGFLDELLSISTTLTCLTQTASHGQLLPLWVAVGNQQTRSVVGEAALSFPLPPRIDRVHGCVADVAWTNATRDCSTEGETLTLMGAAFSDHQLSVWLQHPLATSVQQRCLDARVVPATGTVQCHMDPGTGSGWIPMLTCGAQTTDGLWTSLVAHATVSYELPALQAVQGCDSLVPSPTGIVGCSREETSHLVLYGRGFGPAGLVVLVGSVLCRSVMQVSASPHREASCDLPPGTANHQPILLIQAGGGFGLSANVTLSYQQCPPGTQDTPGQGCVACPYGTYAATPGNTECTPCAPGTIAPLARSTACLLCGAGTFSDISGRSACISCLPGSYSLGNGTANRVCLSCPAGTYAAQPGASFCSPCPVGTSAAGIDHGLTSCHLCQGNEYNVDVGALRCDTCAGGQYYHAGIGACETCPPGVECLASGLRNTGNVYLFRDEQGRLASVPCLPGYCQPCIESFARFDENENSVTTVTNTTSTINQTDSAWNCCGAHRRDPRANPYCGQCEDGFYNWSNQCVECDSTGRIAGYMVLFIVLAWLYITIFHRFAQFQTADTRILSNYAQFVFLFLTSQAGSLTSWMSIFNFNLIAVIHSGESGNDAAAQQAQAQAPCIARWNDLEKLATGLWMPLVTLGLLALNFVIHLIGWHQCVRRRRNIPRCAGIMTLLWGEHCCPGYRSKVDDRTRRWTNRTWLQDPWLYQLVLTYQRTLAGLVVSSYSVLAQTTLAFFDCVPFTDGDSYIHDYPSISCENDVQYRRWRPVFIILLAVISATPVVVLVVLWRFQSAGQLHSDTCPSNTLEREEKHHIPAIMHNPIRYVYGVWAETYKPPYYYWESVVLLRRLVIAVVLQSASLANQMGVRFQYLTMVGVVFLMVQVAVVPYRFPTDNRTELLSHTVLILLTLFLMTPVTTRVAIGLSTMCFALLAYLLVRIAASRFAIIADKLGLLVAASTSGTSGGAGNSTARTSTTTTTTGPASSALIVTTSADAHPLAVLGEHDGFGGGAILGEHRRSEGDAPPAIVGEHRRSEGDAPTHASVSISTTPLGDPPTAHVELAASSVAATMNDGTTTTIEAPLPLPPPAISLSLSAATTAPSASPAGGLSIASLPPAAAFTSATQSTVSP